ncbi:MAG: C40 family peptidase [Actinobacteria bacterium]|nr:C40 family peptidase [Actinomycetota bacterium]
MNRYASCIERVTPFTRIVAAVAVLGSAVAVLVAPASATADPPPNPSDSQISAAQAQKSQLATQVGQLSAQVTQLQAALDQARQAAQLAEQKVALALQQLQDAQDAAASAKQEVTTAENAVDQAQAKFNAFIRATYINGPSSGTTGELLTASDPDALLQHSAYVRYATQHQLDALGELNKATVAKSNADAAARGAVQKQQAAEQAAQQAKQAADEASQAAARQEQSTAATLASSQQQLQTAQQTLATLNNQRAAYDAYQAEQARIRAEQAAAAAAAEAAARATSGSGGGNNGGGVAVAPTANGGWTPAAGQTAANRALAELGVPYSFAAGNERGATYGCSCDYDSRNDSHVFGFDCSGLVLYAWAPYIHGMAHYAASQYSQAGHVHPNVASLMPGDLVFWSDNGQQSGIGHVAIYIGNGNVVQAPQSGDHIRITPLGQVESGYYGATRPLT